MPPMPPMPPTAGPDTAAAAPRAALGTRIAERLPEIVIEALFMLVAVVLAFAVEEWRDERELDGLAAEARGAILQEVARNRDELLESKQGTTDATAALEAWLEQADQGAQVMPSTREAQRAESAEAAQPTPALPDPTVNLSKLALLTSAAWRTAQSTEASRMDFAWMLQSRRPTSCRQCTRTRSRRRSRLVTHRTSIDEATRRATARALLGRIRVLTSLGQALEDDYADIL